MRRRFGRGRRARPADPRATAIDVGRWFERLTSEGHVPVTALEPVESEGVPTSFAALGAGETETGGRVLVALSPENGGNAALAALAHAAKAAREDGFEGLAIAVSPRWPTAARKRLAWVGETVFDFSPIAAPGLEDGDRTVEAEPAEPTQGLRADGMAAACEAPGGADLFRRGLTALQGLAAKHGGVVRGTGQGAELVLLARRTAVLRPDGKGVALETLLPDKSTAQLTPDSLAATFDRLEGQVRKRLNDRRVKSGEESLRAQAIGALSAALEIKEIRSWPLCGSDPDVIDRVGLDSRGRPVIALVRERLDLPAVGAVLDALAPLQSAFPHLFAETVFRPGVPRLGFAAQDIDPEVIRLVETLTLDCSFYDLRGQSQVVLRDESEGAAARAATPRPSEDDTAASGERARRDPRQRQRRGRGPRGGARDSRERAGERADDEAAPAVADRKATDAERSEPSAPESTIDEISLFDLDDDVRSGAPRSENGDGRRRRRRGRRRGRRAGARDVRAGLGDAEDADTDAEGEEEGLVADDAHDVAATLAPVDEDELVTSTARYEEEEEEEDEPEGDWMRERDLRQRARAAAVVSEPVDTDDSQSIRTPPRRRSAIVAHADRNSVIGAVLLARDIRQIDGFWVYPQEELMTFFRGVATDLRSDVPIHVIGFHAKPVRETIQAASLYSGRLYWYDHHDWPPEDLEALRSAIGEGYVEIQPGSGSSIGAVLARRARRSRFSDKLVELATGRFSQHDYERWGRYWWHHLDTLSRESGEMRRDLDPLLAGRPSDLAKATAAAPLPPLPAEVSYVSARDFRVVHSGGFGLVVVPVSPGIDPHMTARLARERFGAQVSLAYVEGEDLVMMGGEEVRGRQSLDLGAMVSHLAAKHEWIEPRRDEDHVARLYIRDLTQRPERLDEVVGAVAMGRSILEG